MPRAAVVDAAGARHEISTREMSSSMKLRFEMCGWDRAMREFTTTNTTNTT